MRHGGSGPPLLLLHGNPNNHVLWYAVAARLAQRYHVVLADLRGYGDSSLPEPGPNLVNYSFRVMAQDSYFGVYCRRWGVPLIDGGTVRLPRIVGQGRALEIILTGRKVPAEECLSIGLCEYLTPKGEARRKAEELAHEIARFPQVCVRADRRSAIKSHGLPVRDALVQEWYNGREALIKDGVAGATRFKGGLGRHGDFRKIR